MLGALLGLVVFGDVVEDDGGLTVYGGDLDFEGFVAVGAVVDVFFGWGEFFATIDTVHSWVPFSFALFDISSGVLGGWKAFAVDFDLIHKCHVIGEVSCCGSTVIYIVGDDAVIFDVVFDDLDDLLYDVAFGSIDVICIYKKVRG